MDVSVAGRLMRLACCVAAFALLCGSPVRAADEHAEDAAHAAGEHEGHAQIHVSLADSQQADVVAERIRESLESLETQGHVAVHYDGAPLNFKADLAAWSGIVFLLFVFVLGKFAWRPLSSGLNSRESRIRNDLVEAEQGRLKAEKMLADHAAKLSAVQDEVREILAEARRDAEHTRQEIVTEARNEAEANRQRAVAEIDRAKDQAIKELFDGMAGMVAEAAEHVVGRSLQGQDQDRLVDEALAQFREQQTLRN